MPAELKELSPIGVCDSIPRRRSDEIQRDNILDNLDYQLSGDATMLSVVGPASAGKTTLLAQFARRHSGRCLALFVSSVSRFAADQYQLMYDLLNQVEVALRGRQPDDNVQITAELTREKLTTLRRRAARKGEDYYFVVDGLEELGQDGGITRTGIFDLLPLGANGFRFLFSASARELNLDPRLALKLDPFPLPFFTPGESQEFFGDTNLTIPEREDLHRACKGMPGFLAGVKQLLARGASAQDLIQHLPSEMPELFHLRWEQVPDLTLAQDLLALLAFQPRQYRPEVLASVLGKDPQEVQNLITNLDFLNKDDRTGAIQFESDHFRRFAAHVLADKKEITHTRVIEWLMRDPESDEAVTTLPLQLNLAGRHEELISYLEQGYVVRFLERAPSMQVVQQITDLGITAALDLDREDVAARFILQKSVVAALMSSEVDRAEVRALTALGDFNTAIALAEGTPHVEDKLRLFAAISRAQQEQGLGPDPDVSALIQALHRQVDYAALGIERAEGIAMDLASGHLNLATEIVANATKSAGDNRLDWAFAKLAITTALAGARKQGEGRGINVTERIQDPLARRLSTEAILLLSGGTAKDVITQAATYGNVSDQMYLFCQWTLANRDRQDAEEVIRHALQTALKAAGYSPNAKVFRELAVALPYINDAERAKPLIGLIDAQLAALDAIGPTEDYVRLGLILARAEARFDRASTLRRLSELYLYISGLGDLATRAATRARLLAALHRIDPEREFEKREGIHTLVQSDFHSELKELLGRSAQHTESAGGIVRALAMWCPKEALQVANELNTQDRRNIAFADVVRVASEAPPAELNVDAIEDGLERIDDPKPKSKAVASLLERLAVKQYDDQALWKLKRLLSKADLIGSPLRRSVIYARLLVALAKHKVRDGLFQSVSERMLASWETAELPWEQIEAGFDIVSILAKELPTEARVFAARVGEAQASASLLDHNEAASAMTALRLAIRAFAGLLPRGHDSEEETRRLERAIELVPAGVAQIDLWSALAVHYHGANRGRECKRIVEKFIKPILWGLPAEARERRARATMNASAALYAAYPASLPQMLEPLSVYERDDALWAVARFLLKGVPLDEPYEAGTKPNFDLPWEQAVEVCQLLGQIMQDNLIYDIMGDLVDEIVLRREGFFNQIQKNHIARLLTDVVDKKLPYSRGILHQGYVIVCRAQILRLQPNERAGWSPLLTDTAAVPNTADRAFIYAQAATNHRDDVFRRRALEELERELAAIPTIPERIDATLTTARTLQATDAFASKEYLRKAMELTLGEKAEDMVSRRRAIIDAAYRIDSEFAAALASNLSDNPAREHLERDMALLEMRSKLPGELAKQTSGKNAARDLPEVAWLRLGSLNAGRSQSFKIEEAHEFLRFGGGLPLLEAYPIFALVYESMSRRLRNSDAAGRVLLPLFHAALHAAELAISVSSRRTARQGRGGLFARSSSLDHVLQIGMGEREKALAYIEQWLRANLGGYLKISEPFFTPEDLDLLRMVQMVRPDCEVMVLASAKVHTEKKVSEPLVASYTDRWRQAYDDLPPRADVVVAAMRGTNDTPVHDRWWVTESGGLELLTSWNGLGRMKESTIRVLTSEEAALKEAQLNPFLIDHIRIHGGVRIAYTDVLLGPD